MLQNQYEILDHTADLGIRVFGKCMCDLFLNAGLALFDLICPLDAQLKYQWKTIIVSGEDDVDLMINWLRELLYLFNGKELMVTRILISSYQDLTLAARIGVTPLTQSAVDYQYEIKAVTYHQARIEQVDRGYEAYVIFDL